MNRQLAVWAIAPLVFGSSSLLSGLFVGAVALGLLPLCSASLAFLGSAANPTQRCAWAGLSASLLISAALMAAATWRLELANALLLPLSLLLLPCMALAFKPHTSLSQTIGASVGFLMLASLLGALREGLGQGGLLLNSQALLGINLPHWQSQNSLPLLGQASFCLIILGVVFALSQLIRANRP